MSVEHTFGVGNESRNFLASGTAVLSLALLLSGSVLHATPIRSPEDLQLRNSEQLAAVAAIAKEKALQDPPVFHAVLALHRSPSASVQPATSGCLFADNCSNPVEMLEPQSLVLLGTSLLSIAGLICSRLVR